MVGRLTIKTPEGTFNEVYQLRTNAIAYDPAEEFWQIVLRRIDLLPNVLSLKRTSYITAEVECFDDRMIDWDDPDDVVDGHFLNL